MNNNLVYLTPPESDFEEAYLAARRKEGRLYPDEVVVQLPIPPNDHPQTREWGLRVHNVNQLLKHLRKQQPSRILDLGCGNGWLTHQLVAGQEQATVLGLDVNVVELEQAQRLFARTRCQFAYGDIFKANLETASFDSIILASCAQYFSDLNQLLTRLLELLRPQGEIHIFDTPFYADNELDAARQRTAQYYEQRGEQAMQNHYFHRSWAELQDFSYRIKYRPNSVSNRLKRRLGVALSPFPWLAVQHTQKDS